MTDELLSTDELAARLGVTRSTIRYWVREHKLPRLRARPGSRVNRFNWADVQAVLGHARD